MTEPTAAELVYADAHFRVTQTGPHTWRLVGKPEGAFAAVAEPAITKEAALLRIIGLWEEYAGYLNQMLEHHRAEGDAAAISEALR